MLGWADVDAALGRLDAVLRPRVGKAMTAVVMKNVVGLKEQGVDATGTLRAIHQYLDAYARIPESGTPFPLGIAKAIGDAGCIKLSSFNRRMRPRKPFTALEMEEPEALSVARHADALLPSYGDDDVEFAVRVAWKTNHHYRLNLVVGRSLNRNDHSPTTILDEAWRSQGARGIPIGAVPVDQQCPGVIYALGEPPSANVVERFRATGFVFEPDHGDPIELNDVRGLQRFFAKVPLAITPPTLPWIVHLVRFVFPNVVVDVGDVGDAPAPPPRPRVVVAEGLDGPDAVPPAQGFAPFTGGLTVAWEDKEEAEPSTAASVLLGIRPAPVDTRDRIRIRAGDVELTYAPGELA